MQLARRELRKYEQGPAVEIPTSADVGVAR